MIRGGGDKALQGFPLTALQDREFPQLDQPLPVQPFHGIFAVDVRHRIAKPGIPRQGAPGRTLAEALGALENRDAIGLTPRRLNPGDRTEERLGAHRPRIGGVLDLTIGGQPLIESGREVPREAVQVAPYRMEGSTGCQRLKGFGHRAGSRRTGIFPLQPVGRLGIIMILNRAWSPGRRIMQIGGTVQVGSALGKAVIAKDASPPGIGAEDFEDIGDNRARLAVVLELQGGQGLDCSVKTTAARPWGFKKVLQVGDRMRKQKVIHADFSPSALGRYATWTWACLLVSHCARATSACATPAFR